MIYIIITTSLIKIDYELRKKEYIKGIYNIIEKTKHIKNIKYIIVENNGLSNSFLDEFNSICNLLYTNNNKYDTTNKGIKELFDIKECISKFNINDDDFIVKFTGRYYIKDNSEFIKTLEILNDDNYDCIIKHASFIKNLFNINDSVTGLIGMRCKYVKLLYIPNESQCIEWVWAEIANKYIPYNKKKIIDFLNLVIPSCNLNNDIYFLI